MNRPHPHIRRFDRILCGLVMLAVITTLVIVLVPKIEDAIEEITPVIEITVAQWWKDEMEAGALEELIAEFEAERPDLRIRLETLSRQKLRDMLLVWRPSGADAGTGASGALPDVIGLDPLWLSDLLENGVLADLAPLPGAAPGETAVSGGRAVPLVSFMNLFYYNIDTLRAAGFDRPPKTQADVLEYARTAGGPQGALVLSNNVYQDVFSWIWAAGATLTHDGLPDFSSRRVAETLAFLAQMNTEGLLFPFPLHISPDEKLDAFINGSAAMMIASSAAIRVIGERNPALNFGVTAIPVPASYTGKSVFGLETWYAGIGSTSEHREEAWAFLAFLAERRSHLAAVSYAVPGNSYGDMDAAAGERRYVSDTKALDDERYLKAQDLYQAADTRAEFDGLSGVEVLMDIVREELSALFRDEAVSMQGRISPELLQ
jgi:multiple sugar transport system substrate-binding protein